jgi:hypothetical protein
MDSYDIPTPGERRYQALTDLLKTATPDEDVRVSFDDWESVAGVALPDRALRDLVWWASLPRQCQSRVWLRQDRRADADLEAARVVFRYEVYERDNTLERVQSIREHWVGYARNCLEATTISETNQHRAMGWWEPHEIYLLHFVADHQYKVGIARIGSSRVNELRRRGDRIVERIEVANLWAAKVVEFEVLQRVLAAWERPHRFAHQGGESERWSDWLEPPKLTEVVQTLVEDRKRPGWGVSAYRSSAEAAAES